MIIFTHIAPEYFIGLMGSFQLENVRNIDVYNLSSLDVRYPMVTALMPTIDNLSKEALAEGNDELFEQEYFHYLDTKASPILIPILMKEFQYGGSNLTIIEIIRSPYRDSVVFSLQKYLYIRYGIRAILFSDMEDWSDIKPSNSIFSINGLAIMDVYTERQDQSMGCDPNVLL